MANKRGERNRAPESEVPQASSTERRPSDLTSPVRGKGIVVAALALYLGGLAGQLYLTGAFEGARRSSKPSPAVAAPLPTTRPIWNPPTPQQGVDYLLAGDGLFGERETTAARAEYASLLQSVCREYHMPAETVATRVAEIRRAVRRTGRYETGLHVLHQLHNLYLQTPNLTFREATTVYCHVRNTDPV